MNTQEQEISYNITNSYSTMNKLTPQIKNIWFVCHGMGYLSRYFINYFSDLNPEENYIVAPQAQSKYYSAPKRKHVGASWLTKENTVAETRNVMRYFDAIFEAETFPENSNLIILGYSQGVSVALRYIASRQIQCSQIAICSGGIPVELVAKDFEHLKSSTRVIMSYGTSDEYLNEERITNETKKAIELFGRCDLKIVPFDGKHEVNTSLIGKIADL